MPIVKEPKFMVELHRIREKLSKEEERLSPKEKLAKAKEDSDWAKAQVAKLRKKAS